MGIIRALRSQQQRQRIHRPMAVLRAVPLADRRARGARAGPERRGPHAPEHARIHRVWPHGRGSARARDQRGWEGREDGSGVERTDMERGAVLLTLSTGVGAYGGGVTMFATCLVWWAKQVSKKSVIDR